MAEDFKKIKIKDLPNTDVISDSDLFVNTDLLETHNITADTIAEYVSQNKHVTDTYINQNKIGVANGVAPLNSSKKINGSYITYGTTTNTAYSGLAGKTLETNLDNHLLDENAHGLGNVDNTSDMDKPVSTAQQTAINNALTSANSYTDLKVDAIMGEGASTTLDTIGEISKAIEEHQDVTDALNAAIGNKVDKVSGKGLSTNDYTTAEKTKLSGIATGAEVNQNAFSKVVVGSTTITADTKTDTLTLVGDNVTLTPDATNDKVTIGITRENVETALGYTPGTSSSNTNITYELSKTGSTITLTGSDGSVTSVEDSDTGLITGIKGDKEDKYRTGDVNLTAENIGALSVDGTAQKAIADENGNTLTVEQISTTEPTNQKVGDSWLLEY